MTHYDRAVCAAAFLIILFTADSSTAQAAAVAGVTYVAARAAGALIDRQAQRERGEPR